MYRLLPGILALKLEPIRRDRLSVDQIDRESIARAQLTREPSALARHGDVGFVNLRTFSSASRLV